LSVFASAIADANIAKPTVDRRTPQPVGFAPFEHPVR
jgi:hypothetical protein